MCQYKTMCPCDKMLVLSVKLCPSVYTMLSHWYPYLHVVYSIPAGSVTCCVMCWAIHNDIALGLLCPICLLAYRRFLLLVVSSHNPATCCTQYTGFSYCFSLLCLLVIRVC